MRFNHAIIKPRRIELKLKQKDLAVLVKLNTSMICLNETGKSPVPIENVAMYARALQLPERDLVIFEN